MSTASQGRDREYRVRDAMIAAGWEFVMRAAASKGAADLLMGHEEHGAALIQVGTLGKNLGPAERTRFLRAAQVTSALPIVARAHRRGIHYSHVTAGKPATWPDWTP